VPIVLDRYTAISEPVPDPSTPGSSLVTAQAGCHVGLSPKRAVQTRFDPEPAVSDVAQPSPWHEGSWESSLTGTLDRHGLALPDLGGISHQTVSGFISTGSAGGTVKWSVHECITGLRVIDANGDAKDLTPDDDWFRAAGVAMGLCGVISTVTMRVGPRFDLVGSETISNTDLCDRLDFYGSRPEAKLPSLEQFLVDTDYARLMWWPQKGFDRLVVWEAARAPYDPNRTIAPYREIAKWSVLSQAAGSILYTILGNLDSPERVIEHLRAIRPGVDFSLIPDWVRSRFGPPIDPALPLGPQVAFPFLSAMVELIKGERHDPVTLGAAWVLVVEFLTVLTDDALAAVMQLPVLRRLFALLGPLVPKYIDQILSPFVETNPNGLPKTQHFADRSFIGLPMDNQMDDLLLTTWFTEIWVPFTPGGGVVQQTISRLRKHFDADGTAEGCYQATGAFSFELYVGKRDDRFFLHPATGSHVFRVDVFWYGRNATDPVTTFFPAFWDLLEPLEWRLHWGKFLPAPDPATPGRLTHQYPDFGKWKAVRAKVDPDGLFLTEYWKTHLGLT
jgi:hypothetical protein